MTPRDPPHLMVEESYFKCNTSKSLVGGIWGKGPFKRIGPPPQCARDEWVQIDRREFKALATSWHGVDWSKEISFWQVD